MMSIVLGVWVAALNCDSAYVTLRAMFAYSSLFVSFWSLIQNVVALRKRSYENVRILAVASGSHVSFCLSRRDLSSILLLRVLAALGWGRLEVNPSVC